jgi:hypothetical protein
MVKINGIETDGRKVAKAIKDQPGYSGEGAYMVAKATTGGYRLYKAFGANLMDASLEDRPELAACLPALDAARALRAIPSAKRSEQSKINGAKGGRPKSKQN